jgi:glutamate-1-semialdehyde aminotransferase
MEVSRMLLDEFPSNDMLVFAKNGSDVCTLASRLARVVTRKRIILSCGFHGWQDFGLNYFRFEDCGIPYRDEPCLYKFRFNDLAAFLALYEQHKEDLAAVMIEPAGPLLDDESGLGGEPDLVFLQTIAAATHKVNALLIFDEIITSFRYRQGSVQKATGVTPDLTCLGKALASGMPLAALLGPYRIFREHFHKSHFNATFKSEVYSLAAARAAIQIYRTEPVAEHVWQYGEALRRGIHDVCREVGVAGECTGPPFRMAFVFREPNAERRQLKRTLLMQELLKQRIITVTGMMLPSYAHNGETLRRTVDAFGQALEVVAYADRRDDLHRHIELTLL